MKVNYNYLAEEFKNPSRIIADWKKLIKSTDFTLGRYIEKFETRFAKYIGAKHCIATNNGTDALILCLKALNIGDGDEVITVCNSFYASAGAIVAVGAKPVFCDSDNRYQICVNDLKKKINRKTKAIMPVHWGGASPNMQEILKIAKEKKIRVVEDACMGIGAKVGNLSPGNFGIINAFSMHPLKSLNVMGDGGVVATNNTKLYSWLLKYRNHGMIDRDNIEFWGVNIRMQPLQAIVALHGLKKLDSVIIKRTKNARFLDKELSKKCFKKFIVLPPRPTDFKETYALYMILCTKRDELKAYLEKKGIETKIHYPQPLHLQKPALTMGYKKGDFKNAEYQAKRLLTLPVHQFLTKGQLDHMIKCIYEFYL
tara:strand:+ start:1368 stop:2474 length:1107 start_codon:yes stop_codon:yes gene_type:complete